MELFYQKLILIFFTALGVLLGASLVGSLGAILVGYPPVEIMLKLAREIKIWAIVAAIGGTFTTIEILQLGILEGEIRALIKQLFYLISAFAGAHLGYLIVIYLVGNGQ
ncbi:YtrH family sporulation protein [Zhaonella formicivorans]|uniref:YtrH family sporulation protein n=1 Tax=Zhaonella formicivorans TaxID=2528593 RepID=UPI0010E88C38|nr:YtrH family sporulation protein [Zhaonella formicivorans]